MADVFNGDLPVPDFKEVLLQQEEKKLRQQIPQEYLRTLLSIEQLKKAGFSIETKAGLNCLHIYKKGKGQQIESDVYLLANEKDEYKHPSRKPFKKGELTFEYSDGGILFGGNDHLTLHYKPYQIIRTIQYTDSPYRNTECHDGVYVERLEPLLALDINRLLLNFKKELEDYYAASLSNKKNDALKEIKEDYKNLDVTTYLPKKIEVVFDLSERILKDNDRGLDIINVYLDDMPNKKGLQQLKLFKNNLVIHTRTINILMTKRPAGLIYLKEVSQWLSSHIAVEQFLFSFLNGRLTDSIKKIKGVFNILLEKRSHEIKRYAEIASATSPHIILI